MTAAHIVDLRSPTVPGTSAGALIVDEMAHTIVELREVHSYVRHVYLRMRGFSFSEIAKHHQAACARADALCPWWAPFTVEGF